jgi:hypothetical protein
MKIRHDWADSPELQPPSQAASVNDPAEQPFHEKAAGQYPAAAGFKIYKC